MKRGQEKSDEATEGRRLAKELKSTGEIMQKAEARKKFLRNIIKTTPAQFNTLRYLQHPSVTVNRI